MNRDTNYHDRLEQEVTNLQADLKVSQTENDILDKEIQQLHQAIAVLNDEPTNSL